MEVLVIHELPVFHFGRDDNGRFRTLEEYMTTLPLYASPATVPGLSRPTYDFDLGTLTRHREQPQ